MSDRRASMRRVWVVAVLFAATSIAPAVADTLPVHRIGYRGG